MMTMCSREKIGVTNVILAQSVYQGDEMEKPLLIGCQHRPVTQPQ
jgi:hypothetical protein